MFRITEKPLIKMVTIYAGLIVGAIILSFMFSGCTEKCETTVTYITYEPVYITVESARNAMKVEEPRSLSTLGKIYLYGQYLLINEPEEGIHVIDNQDKSNPLPIQFIKIPGNYDMAVRNGVLYADSYIDLLTFDIRDVNAIKLIERTENAFPLFNSRFGFRAKEGMILKEIKELENVEIEKSCQNQNQFDDVIFLDRGFIAMEANFSATMSKSSSGGGSNIGIAGSMARFGIVNNYLYAVDDYQLHVFNVQSNTPVIENKVSIGSGTETIFPFKGNLFIGANWGMSIYSLADPSLPVYLSSVSHLRACDPVVANDDYAFVTLHESDDSPCGPDQANQMDVIDIKDPTNAKLITSYAMTNPYGLGLDGDILFLTEGDDGLKIYDISDVNTIDDNLIRHIKGMNGYDVIPFNKTLYLIGSDGLFQYDYSNINDIKLLSKINVTNAI